MCTIFEKTYSQSALTIAKYKIIFKTTNARFKKNNLYFIDNVYSSSLFLLFIILNETFKTFKN